MDKKNSPTGGKGLESTEPLDGASVTSDSTQNSHVLQIKNSHDLEAELAQPHLDDRLPEFRFLNVDEVLNLPDKTWLVKDLFGKGDLGFIYGPSGIGKTFVILDIVCALALGLPFSPQHKAPDRPLKVVYCTGEGRGGLKNRMAALLGKWVKGDNERRRLLTDNLAIVSDIPQLFADEAEPKNMQAFITELSQGFPGTDLIILDTYQRASVGADLNNSKDVRQMIATLDRVREQTGTAIAIIHHTNRRGTFEGSQVIVNASDFFIALQSDGQYSGLIKCEKQKDGEGFPPLAYQLRYDSIAESRYVEWLETVSLDETTDQDISKLEKAKTSIIDLLGRESEVKHGDMVDHVMTTLGIGRSTVIKAIKALKDVKSITYNDGPRNSKIYRLSEGMT